MITATEMLIAFLIGMTLAPLFLLLFVLIMKVSQALEDLFTD